MRQLRTFAACLAMLGCAITMATGAAALEAPVLDRVMDSDTLRVGMSGKQPPLTFRNRSGALVGLDVELAGLLAQAMEVELKIVTKPFGQLRAALKAGEVDVVMSGMAITSERAREVLFVGPYLISGKSILTNSRALARVEESGDLDRDDVKLAALEGSTSQRFIEHHMPRTQLVAVDDYDEAVRMVLDDEVDALVADMPFCVLSVLRYPDRGLVTLEEPLTIEPIGIAMPPNDPLFRSLVQNYLDALIGLGVVEELQAKWLQDGAWIATLP